MAKLRICLFLSVLIIFFVLGYVIHQLLLPLDRDVILLLSISDRLVAGERLYVDIPEINPPIIFWINILLLHFAKFSSIPVDFLYILFVLFAVIFTGTLFTSLLQLKRNEDRIIVTSLVLVCYLFIPGYEFGQRDHIIAALFLPFIAQIDPNMSISLKHQRIIGILLAVGIAIKPHYAIYVFILELYAWLKYKKNLWLSQTNLWLAVTFLLYVLCIFFFIPEYVNRLGEYAQAYHAYNLEITEIINPLLLAQIISISILYFLIPQNKLSPMGQICIISALAYMLIVVIQHKGLDYHYIPFKIAFGSVLLFTSWELSSRMKKKKLGVKVQIACMVVVLVFSLHTFIVPSPQRDHWISLTQRTTEIFNTHANGGTVYNLSNYLTPLFPSIYYSQAQWQSKYFSTWIIPQHYKHDGLYNLHTIEQMDRAEHTDFQQILADLYSTDPNVIIIDENFMGHKINYQAYFSQDLRFRQMLENDFDLIATIDEIKFYARKSS